MLPGACISIGVEKKTHRERAEAGQGRVGHHDHRRVAIPAHRDDDRYGTIDAAAVVETRSRNKTLR